MNVAMPVILESLVLLGIYFFAVILSLPFGRYVTGENVLPRPIGAAAINLVHRILRPLIVLAATPLAVWIIQLFPKAHVWLEAHDAHLTAWWAFWSMVLFINFLEGLSVEFCAVRGRSFPIPGLLREILRAVIILAAGFVILRVVLGADISSLLASTALLTAVIGFALQGVLGNLLAGMSLHVTRSVVPGDWVAIDDKEGEVIDTNWRETRIRTTGGHMIMVPNNMVASSVIHNMSRPTPMRRHSVIVGASYSDAPSDVIAALEEAALSVPEVERDPPPRAILTGYLDFGINYELRFWSRQYQNRIPINGEVNRMIWYKFKRRGIEIPFPMSDKLLNDFMEVVATQRRLEPEDKEIKRRVSDLLRSDFGTRVMADESGKCLVNEQELTEVAKLMKRVRYTKGETLFRQGDTGTNCYIVISGLLRGKVEHDGGAHAHEFDAGMGRVVGEMSLMTSLPRTATLMAHEDVELIEIPSDAFVKLLALRPEIPEVLAKLVADRVEHNKSMYENMKALKAINMADTLGRAGILKRFMRLLGKGN
jgi:small-conductance mechanosensitive channel/CRP-like cAMP-binding protein